jgi:hypothetical protein
VSSQRSTCSESIEPRKGLHEREPHPLRHCLCTQGSALPGAHPWFPVDRTCRRQAKHRKERERENARLRQVALRVLDGAGGIKPVSDQGVGVPPERLSRALRKHRACPHDVHVVGNLERTLDILVDQEHRLALRG